MSGFPDFFYKGLLKRFPRVRFFLKMSGFSSFFGFSKKVFSNFKKFFQISRKFLKFQDFLTLPKLDRQHSGSFQIVRTTVSMPHPVQRDAKRTHFQWMTIGSFCSAKDCPHKMDTIKMDGFEIESSSEWEWMLFFC